MRRALALLFLTSAFVSHSASAFNQVVSYGAIGNNCSAPAIWSGVPHRPTTSAPPTTATPKTTTIPPTTSHPDTPTVSHTAQPATTTAGAQPRFEGAASTAAAGVWVAYVCSQGSVHVYDVLANLPLWSSNELQSYGETFAPRFGADGSVYATSTSQVVKFDLLTGNKIWSRGSGAVSFDFFAGGAQAAADVVAAVAPGTVAFINATTGHYLTTAYVSNLVTSGKYCAGLNEGTMQFYVDGKLASSPELNNVQEPTAGYGGIICASESDQPGNVKCVNTNKALPSSYWMQLNTTLPFAMAGDDLVIGIDSSSGIAQICNGRQGWCQPSFYTSTFTAGVSAPDLPVPGNTTSSVIFGVSETQDGNLWLVGFDLNGNVNGNKVQLNSMPVGLPAAAFDEQSQTMYVAITSGNMQLYVYTA